MEQFILPEKWCVKLNEDNIDLLNNFLKENSSFYSEYEPSWGFKEWDIDDGYYFYFPESKIFASCLTNPEYDEITTQEFLDHMANKKKIMNNNSNYEIY